MPNEKKTIRPSEPPWFSNNVRRRLNKHNKIYNKFKKNGFKDEDKVIFEDSKTEINKFIQNVKENYLKMEGAKLADPKTGQKSYWKIMNRFLNKCKVPRIPPLFQNSKFITDCTEKASLFNSYFAE